MTKTELEKQLAEMQEQFDKIKKQIDELKQVKIEEPKKRWKPELYDTYYFIASDGDKYRSYWKNDGADNWRYLTGNVFKTEQEAKKYKKKIEIQAQFRNFVEERNEKLDWKNNQQNKYFLYYDYVLHKISCAYNNSHKTQGKIYASSGQILKDAIAEIGEENVKKYVLEVEE